MLKAVIFDLDNTLIDWNQNDIDWLETNSRALKPVYDYLVENDCVLPDLEGFTHAFFKARNEVWEEARHGGWWAPTLVHHFQKTLEVLGLDCERINIEPMVKLFAWDAPDGIALFDDVKDVLMEITGAGLKLGLLTNASYNMIYRDREMAALGIKDDFEVRVATSDVGMAKPNPEPYDVVLNGLGVSRDEAVFVGDSLEQDIAGAHNVGMRSVWVIRERTMPSDGIIEPVPDAAVLSLSGMLDILDQWYPDWRKK